MTPSMLARWSMVLVLLLSPILSWTMARAELGRPTLRFRLESLYNEVDLLVRNQRSDLSNRARLDREMKELRVLERIPLKRDLQTLKRELSEHARTFGAQVERVELLSADRPARAVPREVPTHLQMFRLDPTQLVETLRVRLTLRGDVPALYDWIQRWPDDLVRLIEPERGFERPGLTQMKSGAFTVVARAYRFREIRFPRLKPRDPSALLPSWARRKPAVFAEQEPALAELVQKIREMIPETPSLYERKADFLLDSARMSFFMGKAAGYSGTKPVALRR